MEERRDAERLRRRDPQFFEELMDWYGRLVWTVAAGVLQDTGSREDVEECVADVFSTLWEHPERYDGRRGPLRTYLCLLARSRALDRVRELLRHPLPLEGDTEEDPQDLVLRREQILAAEQAMRAMESPMGEILRLRLLYGLRPREIAGKFGLPVEHVYELLRQGRKRLKGRLEEEWR